MINANSDVKTSYDDSTKSILLRMAVLQEEARAQASAAKTAYSTASKVAGQTSGFYATTKGETLDELKGSYQASKKNLFNLSTVLNNLKKAQENIDNFMTASATARGDSQNRSSSSSSADKYKQNVEKQIKILKHKLEMDLISQEEYYNALAALEKKYYLDSAAHRKKYEEEIWALDAEIFEGRRQLFEDWLSDQELIADKYSDAGLVVSQRSVYDDMLKQISKQIDAAYAYGLTEADDYVQELRKKAASLHKTVLSLIQDTYDTFISYVDNFDLWDKFDFSKVDVLKKKLKEIDQLYKDGLLSWKEYVEAHNKVAKSLYDTQKSALEEIVDDRRPIQFTAVQHRSLQELCRQCRQSDQLRFRSGCQKSWRRRNRVRFSRFDDWPERRDTASQRDMILRRTYGTKQTEPRRRSALFRPCCLSRAAGSQSDGGSLSAYRSDTGRPRREARRTTPVMGWFSQFGA